jgi:hypothetical protein
VKSNQAKGLATKINIDAFLADKAIGAQFSTREIAAALGLAISTTGRVLRDALSEQRIVRICNGTYEYRAGAPIVRPVETNLSQLTVKDIDPLLAIMMGVKNDLHV